MGLWADFVNAFNNAKAKKRAADVEVMRSSWRYPRLDICRRRRQIRPAQAGARA